MEPTKEYLDDMTVIADFWVANNEKKIYSIENEGIGIKKSQIYLKKYEIHVIVKKDEYAKFCLWNWKEQHPAAVITKASGKVDSYDLRFVKEVKKGEGDHAYFVLEFAGEKIL